MFIIPYIISRKDNINTCVYNIQILTIGGKELWEESNNLDIKSDILGPNGLYYKNISADALKGMNTYLCEIDRGQTNLNDFYKWKELSLNDNDTFCWKTFIYITDNNGNIWLPIPSNEKISNFKIQDIIHVILSKNTPTKGSMC
jgi:hypothetical protein